MFHIVQISRLRIRSDGDGIRTLIFTAGCPLRCKYCINPKTWNGEAKIRSMEPGQLYQNIYLDRPYFMSTGGGVTFGGGEPLQYAEEIQEFKKKCKGEFSIFAETSLALPRENVVIAEECIDHFIIDIKTLNPDIYTAYTDGDLNTSLDNLKWLLKKAGAERITVRIPEIPGYTTVREQAKAKELLEDLGVRNFDIFKYTVKDRLK